MVVGQGCKQPSLKQIREVNSAGLGLALKAMGTVKSRMEFDSTILPPKFRIGSANQNANYFAYNSLSGQNDPVKLGCVMGLRVILARSLSMGSIPIRSTNI